MKLKNYLLLGYLTVLVAACSSNDDNDNQQMTLKRVETFYPSKADYENGTGSKGVQYYENGEVVLDSTYNSNGSVQNYRKTIQKTGNLIIKSFYNTDNTTTSNQTYTYDDSGRLLSIDYNSLIHPEYNSSSTYTYNSDGSITPIYSNSSVNELGEDFFTTNETGQISGIVSQSQMGPHTASFTYENGNLTKITHSTNSNITDIGNLTYYNVVKPSNLQLTIIQSNNTILENGHHNIGEYSKSYIKSFEDFNTYDSSFNSSGYITHCIYNEIYEGGTSVPYKYEAFYYYN